MRFAPVGAALLAAVMIGVSGCTGAPDREQEALDIKNRIAAMPGVTEVDVIYDNGILEGTRFELDVAMEQATDQQVGAVAAQLDELRGNDFAKFDQSMKISVAKWTSISGSVDLPDDVEQVTGLVRRLRSEAPAEKSDGSAAPGPMHRRSRFGMPRNLVPPSTRSCGSSPIGHPATSKSPQATGSVMRTGRSSPGCHRPTSNASTGNWLRRRPSTLGGSASGTDGSCT